MVPDGYDLSGKVAIVTGGGTGIGAATARLLARYGADLILAGRTEETLAQTAGEIGAATGRRCLTQRADVRDAAQVDALVERTIAELGRVDILINMVGWGGHAHLSDLDFADWKDEFTINLDTAFHCIKAVGPHFRAQRSGAIVNVSSVAGINGVQGLSGYSAAKAGLQMFTRVAAAEWGQYGVRVNCVAPGMTATENAMKDFIANNLDIDGLCAATPLRRAGQPDEVARAIVFLASEAASYITGETLLVNGGQSLGGSGG